MMRSHGRIASNAAFRWRFVLSVRRWVLLQPTFLVAERLCSRRSSHRNIDNTTIYSVVVYRCRTGLLVGWRLFAMRYAFDFNQVHKTRFADIPENHARNTPPRRRFLLTLSLSTVFQTASEARWRSPSLRARITSRRAVL